MESSGKSGPRTSNHYAIAASRGFSYYLPKSAHGHLQSLLKQLPSTARSIYKEYYRDLMSSKACAATSAAAMADFVRAFPRCAEMHNALAREMNAEIENHVHEGYKPVLFPVVDEPGPGGEGGEVEMQGRGKRQRASVDIDTPKKKTKAVQEPSPHTLKRVDDKGKPALMPRSSDWSSRDSSPLPDVPSSEEDAFSHANSTQSEDSHRLLTSDNVDQDTVNNLAIEGHITPDPLTDGALPSPSQPPSNLLETRRAVQGSLQTLVDSVGNEPASPPDTALLRDVSWEEGLEAIEAFDWK